MRDPLTYRYKRTLIEAFGCDARSAVAITKYEPPLTRRFFYVLCDYGTVVLIGCGLAWGLVYGWSLP